MCWGFGIGAREDTAAGFRAPDLSVALLLPSHNRDEKIASILVNLAPSSGASTHESLPPFDKGWSELEIATCFVIN